MSRSGITTLKDNIAVIEAELAAVNYETAAVTHLCWSRRKELADEYLKLADAYKPPQSEEDSREIVEAYFKSYMINYNGKAREGLGLDRWSTIENTKSSSESILLNADIREPKAKFYCGLQYLSGIGEERSSSHAFAYIKAAADDDCVEAQYYLGRLYGSGIGVAQDAGKAGEWNQKAANLGYAPAQDALPGLEWNLKAANQGYAPAQFKRGRRCQQVWWGITHKSEAAECHQKAANQGYAPSQHELGKIYKYGRGVKASDVMAIMWCRKAQSQGDNKAMYCFTCQGDDYYRVLDSGAWERLKGFFDEQGENPLQIEYARKNLNQWARDYYGGYGGLDTVKNELLALLFGIENEQERFKRMLQAICKSTGIGMILAERVGITGKSSIAKGRLGEIAAALNTLVEDVRLKIDDNVKELLKTQIKVDASFVPNLETQYKKLHAKLKPLILEVKNKPVAEIAGEHITHLQSSADDVIASPQDDRYGSPDSFYPL